MSGGIAGAAQDRSRVIALSRATSSKRDTFRGTFMIAIRRRHDLGLTKAKRLAQTLARRLQNESGGTYIWKRQRTTLRADQRVLIRDGDSGTRMALQAADAAGALLRSPP